MTDRITEVDKHYWGPIPPLLNWLSEQIPTAARVLDVGAGYCPFPRANVLVDIVEPQNKRSDQEFIRCAVGEERIPFPDKHFEFVVCRHMLEDMADPFAAIREIERVAHSGYIETPSPIAEMCRGVDGGSPPWRGYNHHRFVVWTHQGELRFVSKYPLVEYLPEMEVAHLLRQDAIYWNTYFLWNDRINVVHRQNPTHFTLPQDYYPQLQQAVEQSKAATDEFWAGVPRKTMIAQIGLARGAAA